MGPLPSVRCRLEKNGKKKNPGRRFFPPVSRETECCCVAGKNVVIGSWDRCYDLKKIGVFDSKQKIILHNISF
jgi:hypothetical protein